MFTAIVQFVLGMATLLFGRRLFWMFVALAGFLFGLLIGQQFFSPLPDIVRFLLALGVGVLMGVLAQVIQRPIAALGGFLALGSIVLILARIMGMTGNYGWFLFLVGGLIGAVLVLSFFDWALIINSAFAGAGAVIASAVILAPSLTGWIATMLLVALAVAGIVFQARDVRDPAFG
jgi:hypothetical protein